MLTTAGFDYIVIDVTNWPTADDPATDIAVLRPIEVLFEEFYLLNLAGKTTPTIAVWVCSPETGTTWQYLLDTIYNNVSYVDLIHRDATGKKVFFLPYIVSPDCYDWVTRGAIESNGGRNDVTTIPMWALFGDGGGAVWNEGVWGFFSPCTNAQGIFTTSMIGAGEVSFFFVLFCSCSFNYHKKIHDLNMLAL